MCHCQLSRDAQYVTLRTAHLMEMHLSVDLTVSTIYCVVVWISIQYSVAVIWKTAVCRFVDLVFQKVKLSYINSTLPKLCAPTCDCWTLCFWVMDINMLLWSNWEGFPLDFSAWMSNNEVRPTDLGEYGRVCVYTALPIHPEGVGWV